MLWKSLKLKVAYFTVSSSSADINPIGGISKTDLKRFMAWACKNLDLPVLEKFLSATPVSLACC